MKKLVLVAIERQVRGIRTRAQCVLDRRQKLADRFPYLGADVFPEP